MFERPHHQRIAHVLPTLRAAMNWPIVRMQQRQGWLDRCMQVMSVTPAKAVVWQRIRQLKRVCVQ